MSISEWRKKIDEIDGRLVELLSARARAAHEIGHLKRDLGMPIYEPDREQAVLKHIAEANPGPLSTRELVSIYERIMDIMRLIQQEEIAPEAIAAEDTGLPAGSEIDPEVND